MDRSQVEEIVSRRLCDVETAIPAKVKSVDSNGTISVEALIKKVTVDGIVDVENLVIDGVKQFVVGNNNACVDIELSVGSQVLLVGLSRHSSEWLGTQSDDAVIPRSAQGNMLNDLVAVPLFRGDRKNGQKSKISLGKDGNVKIESDCGQSIKFNTDGSIDIESKSGKDINIKGNVNVDGKLNATDDIESIKNVKGLDFKTELLSFNSHVHNVVALPNPSGAAIPSDAPIPAPSV